MIPALIIKELPAEPEPEPESNVAALDNDAVMLRALVAAGYAPLSEYLARYPQTVADAFSGPDCSGAVTAPAAADSSGRQPLASVAAAASLPAVRSLTARPAAVALVGRRPHKSRRRAGRTRNNQAGALPAETV